MDPNERLTGIASIPQSGPQGMPMGGMMSMGSGQPPMPQPEMSGPPPMPMGSEEPPMEPMMGGEEPPMSVEQDAMMLAEAVVGRTQGDINAAVDVLDTAKAMLMSSGSQEPQMMMDGGPMYAKMGKPLYAESGRSISNSDSDTLRQMIMDDLAQMAAAATRPDLEGRAVSEADIAYIKNLLNEGQEGRTMSDAESLKALSSFYENMPPLMREGGGELNPGLQALQKERPDVVKKILGKADGGTLMTDAQKYREAIKEARMVS